MSEYLSDISLFLLIGVALFYACPLMIAYPRVEIGVMTVRAFNLWLVRCHCGGREGGVRLKQVTTFCNLIAGTRSDENF